MISKVFNEKSVKTICVLMALMFIIGIAIFNITPVTSYATPLTEPLQPRYGSNGSFLAPIVPPASGSIPISTRAQLESIKENLGGAYHLVNDINLAGDFWEPIGYYAWDIDNPFTGIFDGQGYVIRNLSIYTAYMPGDEYNCAGLFGYINGATIKNVGLYGCSLDNNAESFNSTGAIAGYSANSNIIYNCYNETNMGTRIEVDSHAGSPAVGGLIGRNYGDITLSYCYNNVYIYGSGELNAHVGGLIGYNRNSSADISYCYNTGSVVSSENDLSNSGGFIGYVYNNESNPKSISLQSSYNTGWIGTSTYYDYNSEVYSGGFIGNFYCINEISSILISDSYNKGLIESNSAYGGVAGGFIGGITTGSGIIKNSYNAGGVYARATGLGLLGPYAGAIIGSVNPDTISYENCYWNIESKQELNGIEIADTNKKGVGDGGTDTTTPLTTANMQGEVSKASYSGFDFNDVWTFVSGKNDNHPILLAHYNEIIVKSVIGISVKNQPQLNYNAGDAVNLQDLVITLNYSDTSSEDVEYASFTSKGLALSITEGTLLKLEDNGEKIIILHATSRLSTQTEALNISDGNGNGSPGNGSGTGSGSSSGSGGTSAPSISPESTPAPTPAAFATPSPKPSAAPARSPDTAPKRTPRPPAAKLIMADISASHWAATYINALINSGIINGYELDDGTLEYRPDGEITRVELIKLIAAAIEIDLIENYDGSRFADWDDVPAWAKPYMAALIEAGIVLGSEEDDGIYLYPENNITRQEMITIAIRALGISVPAGSGAESPDFNSISDWAKDSVAFAISNGMINLDTDGSVNPNDNAKRDETAMIIFKLLEFIVT